MCSKVKWRRSSEGFQGKWSKPEVQLEVLVIWTRFLCSLCLFRLAALDFWQLSKAGLPVCFGNPIPCGDELHTLQGWSPGEGGIFLMGHPRYLQQLCQG